MQTYVQARPAEDALLLDYRHIHTELARPDSGDIARVAATDYYEIKLLRYFSPPFSFRLRGLSPLARLISGG